MAGQEPRTFWGKVFSRFGDTLIRDRAAAYRWMVRQPLVQGYVIPDLAHYCGAVEEAPYGADAITLARLEGRRDVWLRIMRHAHLTEDELYTVLRGGTVINEEQK